MSGHSPMEQFAIKPIYEFSLLGQNIVITNSALWCCIVLFAIMLFFTLSTIRPKNHPSRLQSAAEMLYTFVNDLVADNVGSKAVQFIPFIFSLFIFVLFCNLFGMLPYSFTVTSHIIVTFAIAAFIFIGVTVIGFAKHGLHYFSLFVPNGTPKFIAPFIMLIEMFAYFVRPVSLSIRLAANMTAGHIVLKVIASFVLMFPLFSLFPFSMLVALTIFELFIAVLQAYIFTILTCVYLNDALNLH